MGDVLIPVEDKSIFDPNAERRIKIEKAVQTARDIGGTQEVYNVVETNLRDERKRLALEAKVKDQLTTTVKPQATEKPKKWWQR